MDTLQQSQKGLVRAIKKKPNTLETIVATEGISTLVSDVREREVAQSNSGSEARMHQATDNKTRNRRHQRTVEDWTLGRRRSSTVDSTQTE